MVALQEAAAVVMILLNPAQLYNLPDQPVMIEWVGSNLPAAASEDAAWQVQLLSPDGVRIAQQPFTPTQRFDLAALFPQVWNGGLHYVQLVDSAGEPAGSPLVVQPMWPPQPRLKTMMQQQRDGRPMGLRVYVEQRAVLHFEAGDITFAFAPQYAPNTVFNFMHMVDGGLYTNVPCHRILPGFVIQGGDPTGTGMGGPGYWIDLETSAKKHMPGTLSMARSSDPHSAGSQFFICLTRQKCQHLDGQYAAFGDVVEGMDVVKEVGAAPLADERMGTPVEPPVILSAELVPAPPRTATTKPQNDADTPEQPESNRN